MSRRPLTSAVLGHFPSRRPAVSRSWCAQRLTCKQARPRAHTDTVAIYMARPRGEPPFRESYP